MPQIQTQRPTSLARQRRSSCKGTPWGIIFTVLGVAISLVSTIGGFVVNKQQREKEMRKYQQQQYRAPRTTSTESSDHSSDTLAAGPPDFSQLDLAEDAGEEAQTRLAATDGTTTSPCRMYAGRGDLAGC